MARELGMVVAGCVAAVPGSTAKQQKLIDLLHLSVCINMVRGTASTILFAQLVEVTPLEPCNLLAVQPARLPMAYTLACRTYMFDTGACKSMSSLVACRVPPAQLLLLRAPAKTCA